MKEITTIGLDIAKQVFHVVALGRGGVEVSRRRLRRAQVVRYFAQLPPCRVGIEACASAHHWGRELSALGHEVRLMPAQAVKAYRQGQKNDYNDARAIAAALASGQVRAVGVKTVAQQELQCLHRLREGQLRARTQWANRLRSLLAEQGIVLPQGLAALRRGVAAVVSEPDTGLSERLRGWLRRGYAQLCALDEEVGAWDREVRAHSREHPACQRLVQIPGYGAVVASAFVAVLGDGSAYRNGREAAASLGLVPRQHSTGGKPLLLGISKRGDRYLRSLLIHGARAVVSRAAGKDDRLSRWINRLRQQRGFNKACVALANKMARIGWVVLARGETYRPAA